MIMRGVSRAQWEGIGSVERVGWCGFAEERHGKAGNRVALALPVTKCELGFVASQLAPNDVGAQGQAILVQRELESALVPDFKRRRPLCQHVGTSQREVVDTARGAIDHRVEIHVDAHVLSLFAWQLIAAEPPKKHRAEEGVQYSECDHCETPYLDRSVSDDEAERREVGEKIGWDREHERPWQGRRLASGGT